MSTKPQAEALNLDDTLREIGGAQIEAIANGYIRRFLEETTKTPKTANRTLSDILNFYEEAVGFGYIKLTDFPESRRRHNARRTKYLRLKRPLEKERREIRQAIKESYARSSELSARDHMEKEALTQKIQDLNTQWGQLSYEIGQIRQEHEPDLYKPYYKQSRGRRKKPNAKDLTALKAYLTRQSKVPESAHKDPVIDNLDLLQNFFGWPEAHTKIITFFIVTEKNKVFKDLVKRILRDSIKDTDVKALAHLASLFTGVPKHDIIEALSPTSELSTLGILKLEDSTKGYAVDVNDFILGSDFTDLLEEPGITLEKMQARLFGPKKAPPHLSIKENFPYLAREAKEIVALLRSAHKNGERCHILIWGEPNRGKTTFAQLIAEELETAAVFLGEGDRFKNGKSRKLTADERLNDIMFGFRMMKGSSAVKVVDEAEAVLKISSGDDDKKNGISKSILTNLLMQDAAIWIVNDIDDIDEPIRRRFIRNYEFSPLKPEQRISAVLKIFNDMGLAEHGIDEADVTKLARQYSAPIGAFKDAFEVAARTQGDFTSIKNTLISAAHFVFQGVTKITEPEPALPAYYPDHAIFEEKKFTQGSTEFTATAEHLAAADLNESILVLSYGPAGSGKRSLWRYAADQAQLRPTEYSFLDLFGERSNNIIDTLAQQRSRDSAITCLWSDVDALFSPHIMGYAPQITQMVTEKLDQLSTIIPGTHVFLANKTDKPPLWLNSQMIFELNYGYIPEKRIPDFSEKFLGERINLSDPDARKCITPGILANIQKRMARLSSIPGAHTSTETALFNEAVASIRQRPQSDEEAKRVLESLPALNRRPS